MFSNNQRPLCAAAFSCLFVLLAVGLIVAAPSGAHAQGKTTLSQIGAGLQAHLQKMFENPQLRIVVKDRENGELFAGNSLVGEVELDADLEEVTVDVQLPATLIRDKKLDAAQIEAHLRKLFGTQKLRIEPSGDDLDVKIGDDEIGFVIDIMGEPQLSVMVSLDDLPKGGESLTAQMEPLDAANSIFFTRVDQVVVREGPSEESAEASRLRAGHKLKATSRSRERNPDDRWYQIEFADGKPRYVRGKDLLSEKSQNVKVRYGALASSYSRFLDQIGNSQGSLAKYMGFYTFGPDCALQPTRVPTMEGFERGNVMAQRVQDLSWAIASWALWTDGTYVFRARVEDGVVAKFKPALIRSMKTEQLGEVRFYRFDRLEPPGLDDDLAVMGFAENGKLLINVELDGNRFRYRMATRCNNLAAVRSALSDFYKNGVTHLSID